MEQILSAYSLSKETVTAIMMLQWNMKVKVRSLGGDTDFFNTVVRVLQGDTWAPYLFIICLGYIFQTSIDLINRKWLYAKKRQEADVILQKTIMDVDRCRWCKYLLKPNPNKEQAAGDIGLHVNTNKMEYVYFKQESVISTLNGSPLK